MTEKELAEIEALANAATPGPWKQEDSWVVTEDFDNEAFVEGVEGSVCPVVGMWVYDRELLLDPDDARFIAAARTAVPQLIAEVRRLNKLLGEP